MAGKDGPFRCPDGPRVLTVAADAKMVFDALREEIEKRIREDGDLRPISGFASKLPGVVVRIALAFEAMENPNAKVIRVETMSAACSWAPFLIAHFRGVLFDAKESEEHGLLAGCLRQSSAIVSASFRRRRCLIFSIPRR
jgi:hypothetical protein